jgi:hypothetical protein
MRIGTCTHIHPDGRRCGTSAITGSKFCFWHDPAKAKARSDAGRKGGRKSKIASVKVLPEETPDVKVKCPDDLRQLLVDTISQVRRGDMAPAVANSVAILTGHLLKVMEVGEFETRLRRVEDALETQSHQVGPSVVMSGGHR